MLTSIKIKSKSNKKWGMSLIKVQGVYYLELNFGLTTWLIGF
jgi:hypothetical protein